jgi:Flp pilus assembly protein TadG
MRTSTRFNRLRTDESGMSYVFIGMGMMAFLSASMLAIDVGMLMTARNQAQNSADAGALAGATALIYDDYDDRSAGGPAVTYAISTAIANSVMAKNVSVIPGDVQFLAGPTGEQNRVRVTVRRTTSRGNPLDTLIARYFKIATADISAVATAEASPSNAMTCVKPFTIPDRWKESQTPPWDESDGFDLIDKKGQTIPNPDIYIGPDDKANYTGYNADRDAGLLITLKADNGSKIAPSFYQAWDMPGSNNGADDYRWAIANCRADMMGFGEKYVAEPGMMSGPTGQGMRDLIDLDPDAHWDTVNNKVITSKHPSPRVVAIPLFDPVYYQVGKQQGKNASLKFVNYLGFFVERMNGDEVVGRVTPIGGLRNAKFGPAPGGAFPMTIRLVE